MATELVSGAEVERRLGVSREAVRLWRWRPGFPEPVARVGRSMVWDWSAIERWAAEWDRFVRTVPEEADG